MNDTLYEMITGTRPFDAASAVGLAGAILERDPAPLGSRQPLTSPSLERLVRRCLAKTPTERWANAHDVAEELRGIAQDSRPGVILPARRPRPALWWVGVAAVLAVTAAVTIGYAWRNGRSVPAPAVERTLSRVTFEAGLQSEPTWSPDGQFIAYTADRAGSLDIWVQQVRAGRAVQVTSHAAHDRQRDWSPDGQWIAFRSERDGGGIYVVPAAVVAGRRQTPVTGL